MKDFFFLFWKKNGRLKKVHSRKIQIFANFAKWSLCSRNISTLLIKDPTIPQVNSSCTWGGHTGAAAAQCSKLGSVRRLWSVGRTDGPSSQKEPTHLSSGGGADFRIMSQKAILLFIFTSLCRINAQWRSMCKNEYLGNVWIKILIKGLLLHFCNYIAMNVA